ncbi:MAG: hypothetical protein KAH18_02965, partial [Psychromonas sp.]|nr:hypothetical protein [Psychromonas sp.]
NLLNHVTPIVYLKELSTFNLNISNYCEQNLIDYSQAIIVEDEETAKSFAVDRAKKMAGAINGYFI